MLQYLLTSGDCGREQPDLVAVGEHGLGCDEAECGAEVQRVEVDTIVIHPGSRAGACFTNRHASHVMFDNDAQYLDQFVGFYFLFLKHIQERNSGANNIALIRLSKHLRETDFVSSVCIQSG